MKVFEIVNLDTNKKYYVHNKSEFCKDFDLTRRLLDRTRSGERNHHKRFILKPYRLEFIKSEDGDIELYDSDLRGYVVIETKETKTEEDLINKELLLANRKIQTYQDKLRITRKLIREQNREQSKIENFIEDVEKILLYKNFKFTPSKIYKTNGSSMLVQLSDLHFGKVVNLEHNKYNLSVAKERLEKYANEVINYGSKFNVRDITIVITGDLLNLDSHQDSLLTNETNRASVFVEAFDIMLNFIHKLSQHFEVFVQGVLGNESRVRTTEYNSNVEKLAENNFDTMLFKLLKRVCKGVQFIGECNKLHDIVLVGDKHIAIAHGDKFKHTKDEIYKFKARMIEQFKCNIDYVVFGHIHSTLITPTFARSGSLVGADEYAYNGLNISESISSQNIYIIDKEITPIPINL